MVEAQHVGVVKLHFRSGARRRGKRVAWCHWSVDSVGDPVTRITTLGGDITVDHTDAPYAGLRILRLPALLLRDRLLVLWRWTLVRLLRARANGR
jgi:hypothetical protein